MKSTNTGSSPCWMVQCSKCKENYAGTPTMGHQCYKTVTVDNKMCFDSKLIGELFNIFILFIISYINIFIIILYYIILH